jgi:hypothetical protein
MKIIELIMKFKGKKKLINKPKNDKNNVPKIAFSLKEIFLSLRIN